MRTSWFWIAIIIRAREQNDINLAGFNARIRELGGDGAAAVTVTTSNCGSNYLPWLIALPLYPGCIAIHVTGPIPEPHGETPAGPHTHLTPGDFGDPRLLAKGLPLTRVYAPTMRIYFHEPIDHAALMRLATPD